MLLILFGIMVSISKVCDYRTKTRLLEEEKRALHEQKVREIQEEILKQIAQEKAAEEKILAVQSAVNELMGSIHLTDIFGMF